MKLNEGAKNGGNCMLCWCPTNAESVPKRCFEAFGGQVGQEHVIAAHLDGEGKAFSAPSEAKRVPKEHLFF